MHRAILNLLIASLPATRFFAIKRLLCRLSNVSVGRGSAICGGVKFFGRGEIIIGTDCWIGIGTHFYASLGSSICVGDRCDIAPEVVFHNGTHLTGTSDRRAGPGASRDIIVGEGTWIGTRTTILAGASIGAGCVVGAGALVPAKEFGPNVLLVGVPAIATSKLS